jgi:hypothetical protein
MFRSEVMELGPKVTRIKHTELIISIFTFTRFVDYLGCCILSYRFPHLVAHLENLLSWGTTWLPSRNSNSVLRALSSLRVAVGRCSGKMTQRELALEEAR